MRGIKIVIALLVAGMFLLPLNTMGTDTRAAGDAIAGVNVRVNMGITGLETFLNRDADSGADGYYSMNVPVGSFSGYHLTNIPEGYLTWVDTIPETTLGAGDRHQMDIDILPLPDRTVTIKGYLTDSETGAGVEVQQADGTFEYHWSDNIGNYYSRSFDPQNSGVWTTDIGTQSNGYFEFTAPPGDFEVSCFIPDYNFPGMGYHAYFSADSDRWANFTVVKEPVPDSWVSGTVTGDTGPLEYIYVYLDGNSSSGQPVWEYAPTDASGYYNFNVPTGNYVVSFIDSDNVYQTSSGNADVVTSGSTVTVDKTLIAHTTYTLDIQMNDVITGLGIADEYFSWNIWDNSTSYSYGTNSLLNATGGFTANVLAGEGVINSPWFASEAYYKQSQKFNMPADDGTIFTFDLQPIDRSCVLDGTVLSSSDGSPIQYATVEAEISNAWGTYTDTAVTDATGSYSMNVPTGNVDVTVSTWPVTHTEVSQGTTFAQGEHKTIPFSLTPILDSAEIWGYVREGTYAGGSSGWLDDLDGDNIPDSPGDPGDITPPADITDLSIGAVTANSVGLTWTAVGDDGTTDPAFAYNIGYSTSGPISSMDDGHMMVYPNSMTPKSPGASDSIEITGLMEDTTYWFIVGVVDDSSLWGISNSMTATTAQSGGTGQTAVRALDGGTVSVESSAGNASVQIEANALSTDTDITVSRTPVSSSIGWDQMPDERLLVSDVYDFGPDGTDFSAPATITIPYDASDVPSGWDVGMYLWEGSSWTEVNGATVGSSEVTADVNHFSRYAVLATTSDDDSDDGDEDATEDFLGLLGNIGPIPVMLIAILLVVVIIVAAIAGRKKESRDPPHMPRQRQQPPRHPPQPGYPGSLPPPPGPQAYPQQQVAAPPQQPVAPPPQQPIAPPPTQPVAAPPVPAPVPAPAPAPKEDGKPSSGKCSQCGNKGLVFNDDGSGDCPECGYIFWWKKEKEPAVEEKVEESVEEPPIEEDVQEKPENIEETLMDAVVCPQCGSSDISTYPDGSHMCGDCENAW